MTPKEKAKELFDRFDELDFHDCADPVQSAKECALIVADEIISVLDDNERSERGVVVKGSGQDYWEQVKEEINKI